MKPIKIILSLDGGGIRGAATAEFLRLLDMEINGSLRDNFDLFAGTSTGGILAAAIGVENMSGKQLAELYNHENGKIIFPQSFWDRRVPIQGRPKYDGVGKRSILCHHFFNAFCAAKKPTMVTTYDVENRQAHIIKSWTVNSSVWTSEAVDATSAAPTFFPTVNVDGRWLIDGGVIANNPTMLAYAEAKAMWPDAEIKILSIGTGSCTRPIPGEESRGYGAIEWMRHDLMGIITDESVVHQQAQTILDENYLRVNSELTEADDDMDNVSSGNIENLKRLGKKWWHDHGAAAFRLITKK